MHYYSSLDTATSSLSSVLVSLISAILSTLGCTYTLIRLQRLRHRRGGPGWRTRHYFIFLLISTNWLMSLTALVSGAIYLAYGRLSSAVGCTASGMLEFWSQQAMDISILLIMLAVMASVHHKFLWTQQRHWLQTNIAPAVGLVLFLPLVGTVTSQIVWRFRSTEFTYCWVPRVPTYARWVSIDGWRFLLLLFIFVSFLRLLYQLHISPHRTNQLAQQYLTHQSTPAICRSIIDSNSNSQEPLGLFSQSLGNVNRWARARLDKSYCDMGSTPAASVDGLKITMVSNFLKRIFISTHIPSPTLTSTLFDRPRTPAHTHTPTPTPTHTPTPTPTPTSTLTPLPTLRKWCSNSMSALSRPLSLRRSQTAPALLNTQQVPQSLTSQTLTQYDYDKMGGLYAPQSDAHRICLYNCEDINPSVDDPAYYQNHQEEEESHWMSTVSRFRHSRAEHVPQVQYHRNSSASDLHQPSETPASFMLSSDKLPRKHHISRLYVYPLAYLLIWLPTLAYSIISTYAYHRGFETQWFSELHRRDLDSWTTDGHMSQFWPYFSYFTQDTGSAHALWWLTIVQACHMLVGTINTLLFWITE